MQNKWQFSLWRPKKIGAKKYYFYFFQEIVFILKYETIFGRDFFVIQLIWTKTMGIVELELYGVAKEGWEGFKCTEAEILTE